MLITDAVSRPERSILTSDLQYLNISSMDFKLEVSKKERSNVVNDEHQQNI